MQENKDFKDFLISEYIGTTSKEWKENRSFKNQYAQKVVSYKHERYDEAFVVEEGDDFNIYEEHDESVRPYREASDYVFTIYKDNDNFFENLMKKKCITVLLAPVDDIEEIGSMLEDDQPRRYFLDEWDASDVNGSGEWILITDLSDEEFIKKMKEIGFQKTDEFDQLVLGNFDVSTTAGCKKYLISLFPNTKEKEWKRITKYKNQNGCDVRGFTHLNVGDVFVLNDGKASLHLEDSPEITKANIKLSATKSIIQASDFIFSVVDGYETLMIPDCERQQHLALITPMKYWLKNKCMYDQPNEKPLKFMPSDWDAEDLNEGGTWFILNDLTEKDFIVKMKEIGFQRSNDFDKFVGGRS